MKTIRKIYCMAAGLGALLLLAACEHKELCYQHPHTSSLRVVFDWREAPDAAPESMYVWFFPEEGGEPVQYHLAGKAGGAVSLAEGRYDVLALNGDTENIRFVNTKRMDGFTVSASSGSLLASMGRGGDNVPRAEGTEGQAVLLPPDMVYGACLRGVTVVRETDQTITLYPNEKVCRYTVEIVHVKNLDQVPNSAARSPAWRARCFRPRTVCRAPPASCLSRCGKPTPRQCGPSS